MSDGHRTPGAGSEDDGVKPHRVNRRVFLSGVGASFAAAAVPSAPATRRSVSAAQPPPWQ